MSQGQKDHQAPLSSVSHLKPFKDDCTLTASADLASSLAYPAYVFFHFSFPDCEVGDILKREVPVAGSKSLILSRKTL